MKSIIKIALRNLSRFKRRTYLTVGIIVFGVMIVILFSGIGGSFKANMIGTVTRSLLGDLQIHARGYLEAIDNLPLYLTINQQGMERIKKLLENRKVAAYSPRIKFPGMVSSYIQTTSIRLMGIDPDRENGTCPDLIKRVQRKSNDHVLLNPGEIIMPESLLNGLSLKLGDEVVIVANNKDGSVNGITLKVGGVAESVMGPSGRDGYVHLTDAKTLLRMEEEEYSEIAVRVSDLSRVDGIAREFKSLLAKVKSGEGKPAFEVHTWEELSPISSIIRILNLLLIVVKVILIAIVLFSILNVMIMSVYERVSEIGTISAIGTRPRKILSMFLAEGMALGFISSIAGSITGILLLGLLKAARFSYVFGRQPLVLDPVISMKEVLVVAVLVTIISGLASLEPAVKASKLEPVDALRHN